MYQCLSGFYELNYFEQLIIILKKVRKISYDLSVLFLIRENAEERVFEKLREKLKNKKNVAPGGN